VRIPPTISGNFSLLQPQEKGRYILEYVCKQLNILEMDYFGLRYVDKERERVSTRDEVAGKGTSRFLDLARSCSILVDFPWIFARDSNTGEHANVKAMHDMHVPGFPPPA